jgi:hypothetical protein
LDDAVLERAVRGPKLSGLSEGPAGMFRFASGVPAENRQLVERGVLLPWWSAPELRVAFLRPLSGLTHVVDFRFWPSSSRLMYAHSLAWLGLVLVAALRLYRQLESHAPAAIGAALLFAVDPVHASAAGWLSSRNTLLATFFGICALSAWVANRRVESLLCVACALLSGEVGVGALGYIGAHAWIVDRRPMRERLRNLLPIVLLTTVWASLYLTFGFGARASGAYLQPLHELRPLLSVLPERLAASLGAELGLLPADLSFVAAPEHELALLALALAVTLAFVYAAAGRLYSDPLARFWAFGSLLAALPLTAAPPNDRGLVLVGLGVKALLVRLAMTIAGSNARPLTVRGERALVAGFLGWHAFVAPLVLVLRSAQFQALGRGLENADRVLDTLPDLPRKTVVVLNPPRDLFASYVQLERAVRGEALARHFYWLTSATSNVSITRVAPTTLEVSREGGFFESALERLYRRDTASLKPGSSISLEAMRVHIVASTEDGLPAKVQFVFPVALEDDSLVLLVWRAGSYARWVPIEVGGTVTLPREDVARFVLDNARLL